MVTVMLLSLLNNEKNTLGSPAISMTMRMRRCSLARIARYSTTRASRGTTARCHWAITCIVLPRSVRHGHRRWQHNKHKNKNF